MDIVGSLTQVLSTYFADNPMALIAMSFTVIVLYILRTLVNQITHTFDRHMETITDKIESMSTSMASMSKDFSVLSNSFELHVATTEIKLETLERRTDRLECVHLKP